MSKIVDFFQTLWHHRRDLRNLTELYLKEVHKVTELEQAIRCRDYALESLAIPPPPEEPTPVLKPIRIQRLSYAEAAQRFERQNSARFREMDEARRRREQAASK